VITTTGERTWRLGSMPDPAYQAMRASASYALDSSNHWAASYVAGQAAAALAVLASFEQFVNTAPNVVMSAGEAMRASVAGQIHAYELWRQGEDFGAAMAYLDARGKDAEGAAHFAAFVALAVLGDSLFAEGAGAVTLEVGTATRGLNAVKPVVTNTAKRAHWWKRALDAAWAAAKPGPTGGRLCPTCGKEVKVAPRTRRPRDWDMNHSEIPWSLRILGPRTRRGEIENYQEGVSLECVNCNRGGGNRR
jgi:hypothetical protein